MDLGDPTRAVTPTLDGPVLAVLARSGRPLTVGEVAAQAARGSEIGVRRCLARLVEQGIVEALEMGRNRVHQLNRDHVAAAAADVLANLRVELWRRMRAEIGAWQPAPVYACVFGSSARGDGDVASDIDLVVVHPPMPDEALSKRRDNKVRSIPTAPEAAPATPDEAARWHDQLDTLRSHVRLWSGNVLQVVDLSIGEWTSQQQNGLLAEEIHQDGVEMFEFAGIGLSTAGTKMGR